MVVVATYSESRNADNAEVSGGNTLNRYRGGRRLWGARRDTAGGSGERSVAVGCCALLTYTISNLGTAVHFVTGVW